MKIEKKNILTPDNIRSIEKLIEERKKAENIEYKIDLGIFDQTNSNVQHVLLWEDSVLQGYLLLSSYVKDEVEVMCALRPSEAILKELYFIFLQIPLDYKEAQPLFIVSHNDDFLKRFFDSKKKALVFSEYRMNLVEQSFSSNNVDQIILEHAQMKDKRTISLLDGSDKIDEKDLAKTMVYKKNNQIIAKIRIDEEGNQYGIYGFVVDEHWRRKGIGEQVLKTVLQQLQRKTPSIIYLEVDSSNQAAYILYKKLGFQVVAQFDYYQ